MNAVLCVTFNYCFARLDLAMAEHNSFVKRDDNPLEFPEVDLPDLESLNISGSSCVAHTPERSIKKPELFDISNSLSGNQIYTLIPLMPNELEYLRITAMITNKMNFRVDSIEKIENPYLQKAYELQKLKKSSEGFSADEVLLFHGTKSLHFDSICKMNFNWRHCVAHKYGRGVSFSMNATYASNYSDQNVRNKVMIVAKVLIGRSCVGNQFMSIPPNGYDTSTKDGSRIVVVKYEDNDFLPVYKINYHVVDENVGKGKRYKRHGRINIFDDESILGIDYEDLIFKLMHEIIDI